MNKRVPQYIATCESDGELNYETGEGETPDDALDDYVSNHLASFANYEGLAPGTHIDVYIHRTTTPVDAGWSPEEVDPDWLYCMGRRHSTVNVEVPQD